MHLTPAQSSAIRNIKRWQRTQHKQVFPMFGYAGTGKSTILKHVRGEGVIFSAFTGKAAQVLTRKGCQAQTLHSLIYKTKGRSKDLLTELEEQYENHPTAALKERIDKERKRLNQPFFELNPDSPLAKAKLLVIDEVSMVDNRMAVDILSFNVPVLAVGDPMQLPPVYGDKGYFSSLKPEVLLTDIHRSALDSPVTYFANQVRQTGTLRGSRNGSGKLSPKAAITTERVMKFDQIIVGRNKTRWYCNNMIREYLNYPPHHPVKGDRIVCLKNNSNYGVINGEQYTITNVSVRTSRIYDMTLTNIDTGSVIKLPVAKEGFISDEKTYGDGVAHFTYAYAVTCHKAQGSQWGKVLIFDERDVTPRYPESWLYTAVTRAEERMVVFTP